jgi:hypothetical protein
MARVESEVAANRVAMSDDFYRDALIGIRARIGELDARIQDREAEVTEEFWENLSPETREQLASLRMGRELIAADTHEELARGEGMLTAYLAELDRLIGDLPDIEASWAELPQDVPDPPEVRLGFNFDDLGPTDEADREAVRNLTAIVRARASDAEVIGESPMYIARFREHGIPFSLRAVLYTQGNRELAEVAMCLVTSIPRALPSLVVRHESLVLSIGKVLGLKHEVEVGDPSFDGLFLIEGTKAAADMFLVREVRTQLLALSRFDIPTLQVDPKARIASLQWRYEPAAKALDAAVRVLTAVRETPPSLHFRKMRISEDDR